MQLKEFQTIALEKLSDYLTTLKEKYTEEKETVEFHRSIERDKKIEKYCTEAWKKLDDAGKLPLLRDKRGNPCSLGYKEKEDGSGNPIPNICIKVPTGGGKTLLGVSAIERINADYFLRNTGLVLWIVPTEAIYRQTVQNFKDKAHPYRLVLERTAAGKVKILEKTDAFSKQDIEEHLCVMVIMLQSANRETKESLRVFKDSGNFIAFFPQPDDYKANEQLLGNICNLDFYKREMKLGGAAQSTVKHSLGNAVRVVRPIIILDEGHRAYSDLARETISGLNPRFILELSATPNMKQHKSNVLVSVSGLKLKEEEMIKLPINVINPERADWKQTLSKAYEKLKTLDKHCERYYQDSARYIRPIMLIQVERTGKEQRGGKYLHTEDVKDYLSQKLGITENAIRVKTAQRNELKDESLLSKTSQVRFIITKHALQEGWDCPYAYILAILSNAQSKKALTQLIGRILRQPYAERTSLDPLNESYVFCSNPDVEAIVKGIKEGLQQEGMGDVIDHIRTEGEADFRTEAIGRRRGFKRAQILLPKVLYRDKKSWRNLCYESDILQDIDFSKISYSRKDTFTPGDIDALRVNRITMNVEEDDAGRLRLLDTKGEVEMESITMDFAYMVRRLCGSVPNPWQAARILEEVMEAMKAKGISDEKIYLDRSSLLGAIESDIKDQINAASEKIFRDKLGNGDICFKIFKSSVGFNWKMANEVEYPVSDDDKVLKKRNDEAVQLSLFERTYEKHYNDFEKKVAWYLDDKQAIKWWRRMIARQDYYLQGWQKRKVYPDFLACVDSNGAGKIAVIESKGDHLKGNDDTQYKEKLFELLENHANNAMNVGTVETASTAETKMVFDILMEKSWEDEIKQIV